MHITIVIKSRITPAILTLIMINKRRLLLCFDSGVELGSTMKRKDETFYHWVCTKQIGNRTFKQVRMRSNILFKRMCIKTMYVLYYRWCI